MLFFSLNGQERQMHIKHGFHLMEISGNSGTHSLFLVTSGDVLLSINGIDLTQLTYNEAVSVMKAQTAQSQVVLRVIQTLSEDTEEDGEAASMDDVSPAEDLRDDALNWTPLWTRWLGLPRYNLFEWPQNLFISM